MKVKHIEIYNFRNNEIKKVKLNNQRLHLKTNEYFDIDFYKGTLDIIIDKKNRFNFRDLYYDIRYRNIKFDKEIKEVRIIDFAPLYDFIPTKKGEVIKPKENQKITVWRDKRDFTLYILIEEE